MNTYIWVLFFIFTPIFFSQKLYWNAEVLISFPFERLSEKLWSALSVNSIDQHQYLISIYYEWLMLIVFVRSFYQSYQKFIQEAPIQSFGQHYLRIISESISWIEKKKSIAECKETCKTFTKLAQFIEIWEV